MIGSVNTFQIGKVMFVERVVREPSGLGRAESYTMLDDPSDAALGEEVVKHLRGEEIGQRPRQEMPKDAGCRSMGAFHKQARNVGISPSIEGGYVVHYARRVGSGTSAGWLSETSDPSSRIQSLEDSALVGRVIRELFALGMDAES